MHDGKDVVTHEQIEDRVKAVSEKTSTSNAASPVKVARPRTDTSGQGRKSFWAELSFWSGYNRQISLWRTMLGPLQMARSPIVLWTSLVYMTAVAWIVILTIGASQIFASPPYNFSIGAVGNTFLSPFLASIAGTLVAKPLIDGGVRFMAKRNHGIFGKSYLGKSRTIDSKE